MVSNSPTRSRREAKVAAEGVEHGRKRFITHRIVNRVALRIDSTWLGDDNSAAVEAMDEGTLYEVGEAGGCTTM